MLFFVFVILILLALHLLYTLGHTLTNDRPKPSCHAFLYDTSWKIKEYYVYVFVNLV